MGLARFVLEKYKQYVQAGESVAGNRVGVFYGCPPHLCVLANMPQAKHVRQIALPLADHEARLDTGWDGRSLP